MMNKIIIIVILVLILLGFIYNLKEHFTSETNSVFNQRLREDIQLGLRH